MKKLLLILISVCSLSAIAADGVLYNASGTTIQLASITNQLIKTFIPFAISGSGAITTSSSQFMTPWAALGTAASTEICLPAPTTGYLSNLTIYASAFATTTNLTVFVRTNSQANSTGVDSNMSLVLVGAGTWTNSGTAAIQCTTNMVMAFRFVASATLNSQKVSGWVEWYHNAP